MKSLNAEADEVRIEVTVEIQLLKEVEKAVKTEVKMLNGAGRVSRSPERNECQFKCIN